MAEPTEDPTATPGPSTPTSEKTTALALRQSTMARAFDGLMPASLGEAFELATHLSKSNAIPSTLGGSAESVLTVVLAGMELGMTPIRAIQSITNIKGKLAMSSDLQLALVRQRGTLSFYSEGYEESGRTDTNLSKRIDLAMRKFPDEDKALIYEQIVAAVTEMPKGKPYAWAVGQRAGEGNTPHVRVFSWLDASRAMASEDDGKKTTLAEKWNYRNYPGDMYPKRARTRLLQLLASDVMAGLPAIESIDAEVMNEEPIRRGGPDVEDLLGRIGQDDQELAAAIVTGFDHLQYSPAKRLQLLTQYQDNPKDLARRLRDEYARTRTGAPAAPGKTKAPAGKSRKGGKDKDAPTAPDAVQDGQVVTGGGAAPEAGNPATSAEPTETQHPTQDEPYKPGGTSIRDLAGRFRQGPSKGGSF